MKWLLIAATLLLGIGIASAQVPVPQNVPVPAVPSGLDVSGNFTQRLVNFTDLNFGTIYGAQSISTSQNTAQWGSAVYVLDSNPGYQVNNVLQGQCLDDGISFVIGFITALDSSSGSTVLILDVTIAQGGSPCSNWFFQVINGPTNGVPPSQALAISTTSFALPVAGKEQTLTVDANKGYTAGSLIFIAALGDSSTWCWAVVENYNTSTGVMVTFVVQSSGTGLTYTNWTVGMNGTLAPFVPILGFSGTSLTFATTGGAAVMTVSLAGSVVGGAGAGIAAGSVISMTTQTGLLLNNSHIVVSDSADSTKYFRGIGQYNSVTGAIKIYVTDVHAGTGGTISTWSLFAQDGPPVNANQIAVSQSSATLGAGDFTFTIQAGQNLPIQGPVTLTALASPLNQMLATIKAYSGTSLIVTVLSSGVYGSGTFTAWSILNTGPAQTRIAPFGISGLQVSQSGTTASLIINAGCVRNSSDTADLCLSANTTLDLSNSANIVTVQQPGTVTSFGGGTTAIVGSGSTFTTSFAASGTLTDLSNQTTALGLTAITARTLIWDGAGVTTNTSAIADDTHATAGQAVSGANGIYYRGGPITTSGSLNLEMKYGIILAYQTSTGTVTPFGVSFTKTGTIDLPTGYSYYRVVAAVSIYYNGATYSVQFIKQPLMAVTIGQLVTGVTANTIGSSNPAAYALGMSALPNPNLQYYSAFASFSSALVNNAGTVSFDKVGLTSMVTGVLPTANGGTGVAANGLLPTAVYSATITPTALGINESSCNTTTGVVTFASNFSASLTASGQSVVLTGTVSTGYTTGTAYYVNIASNTTLTTWTVYADAVAGSGASQVKCSVNNNTGWSLRWFAYSNVFNVGFSTITPVGATPGGTTMKFDFNLVNALATTAGAVNWLAWSLDDTAPAQQKQWGPAPSSASGGNPFTFASTVLVQLTAAVSNANTALGTWGNQSTNAFAVNIWVWGFLFPFPAWRRERDPANDNDLQLREVA